MINPMNRKGLFSIMVLAQIYFSIFSSCADEENCSSCSYPVEVSGQLEHSKIGNNQTIQGASNGDEAAFREQISGRNFTVTVSHLPTGKYTVIIGEVETYFTAANRRIFNISSGETIWATNLDIFAVAGGAMRVIYLTNEIEHLDDSLQGPLQVKFNATVDRAKFNTFEIKDANGATVVYTKAANLSDPLAAFANKLPEVSGPEIWRDPSQPLDARVKDLISRLSLAEKVQQVRNDTKPIPRLGIPAYDFWNEALHGVARNGIATVFPQAIGMAATWDTPLIHEEGEVIATEGRAKFNEFTRAHNGNSKNCSGLTFWSPNINIYRDPRWGRGQETYGEDPLLTGKIGVAFIRGVQGDNTNYVKAMACAKHFAVHSGPEPKRHSFNTDPPERDFYETYLPQFEMAVREGHVDGVMGAYNAVFGTPCCASQLLLSDILRKQWGFDGYIVSDCGAIEDIYAHHHFSSTPEAGAAAAIQAGCDICCGGDYNALVKAVHDGMITETEVDNALAYSFKARFRLGLFDPPDRVPYSKITMAENDTPEHAALALKAARESVVLLKNNGLLPLNRSKITRILVTGDNADSLSVLLGNYSGTPSHPITILNGLKEVAGTNVQVTYYRGCPLAIRKDESDPLTPEALAHLKAIVQSADVVVYVGGISPQFEGEAMSRANAYAGFNGGDRTRIELPSVQEEFLKALRADGKPVVFINCSGGAVAMPWEAKHLDAILQAWYPGEAGGKAVAEILFGDVNPSGRLPVTFYRRTGDLPDFEDYSMSNRTYRYFNGKPLFAFGHGLSYTKFDYKKPVLNQKSYSAADTVRLTFRLTNTGAIGGDEVAQVYFRHKKSAVSQPKLALCGFTRMHLAAGETAQVTIEIPAQRFRYWDTGKKQYVVEPGNYELLAGAASDDIRLKIPFKINTI